MSGRAENRLRFHVPKATHEALKAIAAARGESLSQTIRRAVECYVTEAKTKPRRSVGCVPPVDPPA